MVADHFAIQLEILKYCTEVEEAHTGKSFQRPASNVVELVGTGPVAS